MVRATLNSTRSATSTPDGQQPAVGGWLAPSRAKSGRPAYARSMRQALALVLALVLAVCTACAGQATPPAHAALRLGTAPDRPVTKLLVFVEENHSLGQMRRGMPYTFALAKRFGYASSYFAITHPSLPNYLAIASGRTHGIGDDNPPSAHPLKGRTVFDQALAAGRTARLYADGMSTNCARQDGGDHYGVKHNPWAYFPARRGSCRAYDVPVSRLPRAIRMGRLPTAGMVIPNLCHDAHDCSLATADAWFQSMMTKIFRGPDWRSGHLAVVLTADEDDRSHGNRVLTVVIHPSQDHHRVSQRLTHYSLTRLYEDVARTHHLFHARSAPSLSKAFGLPLR
jgi:phosphatidylinositol-3-phosphatase